MGLTASCARCAERAEQLRGGPGNCRDNLSVSKQASKARQANRTKPRQHTTPTKTNNDQVAIKLNETASNLQPNKAEQSNSPCEFAQPVARSWPVQHLDDPLQGEEALIQSQRWALTTRLLPCPLTWNTREGPFERKSSSRPRNVGFHVVDR